MTTQQMALAITHKIISALSSDPGMSVKELASKLELNRRFMAGFLTALEERGEVSHRQVGPARIYFVGTRSDRSKSVEGRQTVHPRSPAVEVHGHDN